MTRIPEQDELSYSLRRCTRCGARLVASRGLLRVRWTCPTCTPRRR